MTRYRMQDGTIVNTDNATESWGEETRFNGSNHISVNTGSQWSHQQLYRSKKGRFYIEHWSQYQESTPHVEWVSNEEATRWLLLNNHNLPKELIALEKEVSE